MRNSIMCIFTRNFYYKICLHTFYVGLRYFFINILSRDANLNVRQPKLFLFETLSEFGL